MSSSLAGEFTTSIIWEAQDRLNQNKLKINSMKNKSEYSTALSKLLQSHSLPFWNIVIAPTENCKCPYYIFVCFILFCFLFLVNLEYRNHCMLRQNLILLSKSNRWKVLLSRLQVNWLVRRSGFQILSPHLLPLNSFNKY